jgi:opacity protein-like surface antigen
MKKFFFVSVLLVILMAAAYAMTCQLCNGRLWFTGNTRVEYGKLLYEYECASGHSYWVVR